MQHHMNTKQFFHITLAISILVQILTGMIDLGAIFVQVPPMYYIIKQLLTLELLVQFFEGMFYVWLAFNYTKILNVTPNRYMDWVITTPSMLITLMIYLIFLKKKVENKMNELDFFTLLKDNSKTIIPVVLLNWVMLLFGYLGEMKMIPVLLGVILGFIPFLIYYYIIYVNYVTYNSRSGYLLFWYFFFFWSLYGVVAMLPYYLKNAFYNVLDLFAKNFFGLFLSYIVISGNY